MLILSEKINSQQHEFRSHNSTSGLQPSKAKPLIRPTHCPAQSSSPLRPYPYLNLGIFNELKDISMFNTVRVSFDTIEWENEADMDPEILYSESALIECQIACEPKAEY
jgi:hypothetical protein